MKIISLELFNFKRLTLSNIDYFKISPTENIQLILGTNGSGKSSIIQELTPLPANSIDYKKDGYKIITIEHHGNQYTLKSTFSGVQKHNFLKNSEELNPGGTLTVQRDLVKQEFLITPDIHELLISQKGFHAMPPPERRNWFTRLSDVNYDYAISIYLRLKEKSRDVTGALKLAKKRLVTETSKSITQDEQLLLQEQVDGLHEFIQHLTDYRMPVDNEIVTLKNNISFIENNISKLSTSLFKKKASLKFTNSYQSIEEVNEEILKLNSLLSVEKILLDKYNVEFNKLDETVKILRVTENSDIETLINDSRNKTETCNNLFNKQKLKLDITSPNNTLRAFDTVYDILTSVFSALPENSTRKFSKVKLNEVSAFILQYKDLVKDLTSDLNKLSHQKEHQEHKRDEQKIECPVCNHSWSKGYDEGFYNSVCNKIEALQSSLDEATSVLLEKELYQAEIKDYSDIYRDFTNCINNWPILKPLWDHILGDQDIFNNPRKVLNTLETFKYDLGISIQMETERVEIDRIKNLISLAEIAGNENINSINQKLIEVEDLINISTEVSHNLSLKINSLQTYKKDVEFILDLQLKIESFISEYDEVIKDTHETYRRISFNELIRSVQITLSRKEQILSEIKVQKAIINDLENQIALMEVDSEAYKLLVKELSPTDGLIAQGLMGFIKNFVKQMNSLIKKIWTYPLQVIPCGISDGTSVELDYKFPLLVQSKDNVVPDVSKGSAAMREVVDLAFKVISMKYLGLSESPIYLDEPCTAMDNEHKISSMKTIMELIERSNFTQLFIISHDHAQYGSLINAQICILCQNNIVTPAGSVFNKHVITS